MLISLPDRARRMEALSLSTASDMQERFSSAGFVVLRTPALPWDAIETWSSGMSATRALEEGGDTEAAIRADIALLRERLRTLVRQSDIRTALYVASPDLFARLGPWLDADDSENAHKVELAIVRYIMRMAGRATPFGLFAGTSIGAVGHSTSLVVAPRRAHARHTRLDAEYVYDLADLLSQEAGLSREIRYRPTRMTYRVGGHLRYYESRVSTKARTFRLVDVEPTPYLHAALERARTNGGATLQEIAAAVCSAFDDVKLDDALGFVEALVDAKLLCDTLSPALTGNDPALDVITTLSGTTTGALLATELASVVADIERTDACAAEELTDRYRQIVARLQSLHAPLEAPRMLRIDLSKPGTITTLSQAMVDDARAGLELLARVAGTSTQSDMRRFVREFELNYHGREVPLLQTLDEESGIGFGTHSDSAANASSLLAGVSFDRSRHQAMEWNSRTAHLFRKLADALRKGVTEIRLSATDVDALSTQPAADLPAGASVLISIAAASADAADRGEYRMHLRKAFGPNSGKLLGRFCQGHAELRTHVESVLRREEACDPEAIHAEIVHLPHRHAANAICRPVLRQYEIPLFERSGAPAAQQIPLDDLFVSVERGRVILRSASHDRRVVPHLTCAHAFRTKGVGLYRFLASLEEQDTWSELSFSWGPLASAPYLPRVVHGRFVISLAQWRLSGSVLRRIDALPLAQAFSALQDLRVRLELPRFVLLVDSDNALPVDFDNVLSLQSFIKVAKRASTCVLSEIFPPPDELLARGEDGRFCHEVVIPFVRQAPARGSHANAATRAPSAYEVNYKKYPGSDWLFVKVYCGASTIDRVLADLVSPLLAALRAERAIDRWFFVRHDDPKRHLRLRFHGEPSHLWKEVAPRLFACLSGARDLIQHVTVDTYDPEEERYGGTEALRVAERIFEADSEAALAIIQEYRGDLEARWRLTLCGMNALLDDFGLSLEQKAHAVDGCRSAYRSTSERDARLERQLGTRYRKLRSEIEALLDSPSELYDKGAEAIRVRSHKLIDPVAVLHRLEDEGRLWSPLIGTVGSYLHMWANRMFRDAMNAQEHVLYELLCRFYEGQIERQRNRR